MRKALHWGMSRVQKGEICIQLDLSSEATSSWAPRCAHRSYTISWAVRRRQGLPACFVSALTALGRVNWNESCHQSKDKATLLPGFLLRCTHPAANSGYGHQGTVSIILSKETRSSKSLKASMVLNDGCHLVSTDMCARHQMLYISSLI